MTRDTKGMFAGELEIMMARIPLSKVRVVDLCSRCGVERRVFYYHFKDKYDLVAWMFERDYSSAVDGRAPYSEELYAEAHRRLWARRDFYRRAFEDDSQNSIHRYLLQFSIEANEWALRRYLGVPVLSRGHSFEARHFAHGNVGCVMDWLRGAIDATSEQLAACMFASMPTTMREAYAAQAGARSGGGFGTLHPESRGHDAHDERHTGCISVCRPQPHTVPESSTTTTSCP